MGPLAATTLQEVQARVQLLGRRHVLAQRTGRGQRLRTSVCYQHARPQHSFSSVEGERVREHWHRDRTQTLHGPHFYLLQHIHVEMFMVMFLKTSVKTQTATTSTIPKIKSPLVSPHPCCLIGCSTVMSCHQCLLPAPGCSPHLPRVGLGDTSPAEGEEQLGLRQEIWDGCEELRLFREQRLSGDLDEELKTKLSHPHA